MLDVRDREFDFNWDLFFLQAENFRLIDEVSQSFSFLLILIKVIHFCIASGAKLSSASVRYFFYGNCMISIFSGFIYEIV